VLSKGSAIYVGDEDGYVWYRRGSEEWKSIRVDAERIVLLAALGVNIIVTNDVGGVYVVHTNTLSFRQTFRGNGSRFFSVRLRGDRWWLYGHDGQILVSDDDGQSWSIRRNGGADSWSTIAYGNGDTTFLGAGRSRILRSYDGGITIADSTMLMNVPTIISEESSKNRYRLLTSSFAQNVICVGGELGAFLGVQSDSLFVSENGGESWIGAAMPRIHRGLRCDAMFVDMNVRPDGSGWLIAQSGSTMIWIYTTDNLGRSWDLDTILPTFHEFVPQDSLLRLASKVNITKTLFGTAKQVRQLRATNLSDPYERIQLRLVESRDSGRTWTAAYEFDDENVWPNNEGSLFVSSSGIVYRDLDSDWETERISISNEVNESFLLVEAYAGSESGIHVLCVRNQMIRDARIDTVYAWYFSRDCRQWERLAIDDSSHRLRVIQPRVFTHGFTILAYYVSATPEILEPSQVLIVGNHNGEIISRVYPQEDVWRQGSSLVEVLDYREDTVECYRSLQQGNQSTTVRMLIHLSGTVEKITPVVYSNSSLRNISGIQRYGDWEILTNTSMYVRHVDSSYDSWSLPRLSSSVRRTAVTSKAFQIHDSLYLVSAAAGTIRLTKRHGGLTSQVMYEQEPELDCASVLIQHDGTVTTTASIISASAYTLDGRELPLSWSFAAPILTYERPVSGPFLLVLMDEKGTVCAELLQ